MIPPILFGIDYRLQKRRICSMGFRFQRRLNFGSGLGLNLSKTGVSPSARTFFGSIGSRGFGLRTGIPGVSYRKSWGKGGPGLFFGFVMSVVILAVNLLVFLLFASAAILAVVFYVAWIAIVIAFTLASWCVLTAYDFVKYLLSKGELPEKTA